MDVVDRKIRGFAILAQANTIRQVSINTFKVKSQSGNGEYVVTNGREWDCTCPDHIYRLVDCKHIWSVKQYLYVKEKQDEKDTFQIYHEIVESDSCKYCGSPRLVKRGMRKNKLGEKRQYECKKCGRWFVVDEGFSKMRHNPKIITLALDLYFKGLSLRKVASELRHFFNIRVSQVAVYKWLIKYTAILGKYLDTLEPKTSGVWCADEMMVKADGWKYLWNVLDPASRFWIANHISEGRKVEDAQAIFQKARENAKKKPTVLITDGLASYTTANLLEFYHPKKPSPIHLRVGLRGKINNNRIERFHGTVRERDKVMRAMKSERTAKTLMEGYRAYYNLIREHQALEGRTPSEVAGIETPIGNNKWLELIRKARK